VALLTRYAANENPDASGMSLWLDFINFRLDTTLGWADLVLLGYGDSEIGVLHQDSAA